jgi:AcrR family transcriptional regulator
VSKDGLLAELVTRATDDYRRAMWPALTGTGTGAERLAQALEALCASAEEHMALLVALRAQSDAIFHRDEEEALTRTVYTEPLEKLLREGAATARYETSTLSRRRPSCSTSSAGPYIHLRTGHGWAPQRALNGTLDPVLHGLLTASPRP